MAIFIGLVAGCVITAVGVILAVVGIFCWLLEDAMRQL